MIIIAIAITQQTTVNGTKSSIVLSDGIESWRITARDGAIAWDYTLTPTGFAGTEDVDWYNPQMIS